MITQTLYLFDWDWLVKVFYETEPKDATRIVELLKGIGCKGEDLESARESLEHCNPNTGLTYSNFKGRCSVVAISRTTCADEFANSYDHEKMHLAMNIADADGIDIHSEEYAYLAGAISQQMFKVARKFMCDCCREK